MADDNDQKPNDEQPSDASSRAGQFLEGPITQNCSPEQAGYRCATQTPGCEPTGFTGQCTKQPEVGGAWPCITAMPFCAEPTGFTGQCTQHPWPNPTRYVGCTVLHCPTNDLTHQPQICRVVEQGLQGGGQPQAQGGANAEAVGAAAQPTALLGCGYTQTWGLCPTHLLGCGFTQQWGPQCPPQQQQQRQPQNFAAAQQPTYPNGDCTFFGCPPQTLIPPQCQSMLQPCITQTETPDCGAQVGGGWQTVLNCQTVVLCPQLVTLQAQCLPRITIRCPEFTPGCPWQITPRLTTPVQQGPVFRQGGGFAGGGAVGAAAAAPQAAAGGGGGDVAITLLTFPPQFCAPTPATRCFICPPKQGHSPLPWFCPPSPLCPSPLPWFCPPRTIGIACTIVQCHPQLTIAANVAGGGGGGQTAATVCTQLGCPTYPNGDCTFFGCPPQGGGGQTAATVCTQVGCPTYPNGDCTFFGCPPQGGGGQTAATVCTQFGQQCQSAVDACPTRLGCGGGGEAVGAAGIGGNWPTPATRCFVCDPMQAAAAAPTPSAVDACPTRIGCPTYPNGDCTFFGCPPQGGGGGGQTAATVCTQFGQQCQSAVDACPTRLGCPTYPNGDCTFFGCNPYGGGGGGGTWPTPMTRCFIC